MDMGFGGAILVFGGLLAVAAGLSGLLRGTVLSISILAVAFGIGLAAAGAVSVDSGDAAVVHVVEIALILTLFADGLLAERELLRVHWGSVTRAIVLAMPVTLVLLGIAAHALFPSLNWAEAFLLAAVLTPTDPVVTSSVVTSLRVPAIVRHTLNLESGLNDGLALPFVLFFLILAQPGGDAGGEATRLVGEAAFGAFVGVVLGFAGGRLHGRLPGGGMAPHNDGIYALGIGLMAFGLADVTIGNGLIAAFVCGITLGVTEHDIPEEYIVFAENLSAIAQVITFFIFGALIWATGFGSDVWRLVVFIAAAILVARPLSIGISFVRSKLPRPEQVFIAWFGPKGVASMLFALFVLDSHESQRSLIFSIAAFTVITSIVVHGLTDTVGTRWLERLKRDAQPRSGGGANP